jgi:hypothetical protein
MKTHCKLGHPLAGDNLYVRGDYRGCRVCRNAHSTASKHRHPDAVKNTVLKRTYGLTLVEREEKLARQDYRCAICKERLDDPHVDHDHETNQVRDLLCRTCNLAVGYVQENILIAEALVSYLMKWKQ